MIARIIPTRIHGVLDYCMAALLIAAPWLFHFDRDRVAMAVPVTLGIATILYSLLTNYEYGVFRLIPMSVHLTIDIIAGVLLACSPWIFGFSDRIIWPHLTAGILEILIALVSSHVSSTREGSVPAPFTSAPTA